MSKSLYIDESLREDMEEIYLYAWEKQLKSTYYCFIDKVVKGEKYTEKVNKRGSRNGFGGGGATSAANGVSSETSEPAEAETRGGLEAKARQKFGDEAVDKALQADADSCPTDPMLRRICPACE